MEARLATTGDLDLVRAITEEAYDEYKDILDGPPLPVDEDYRPRIDRGEVWLVVHDGVEAGLAVLEEHGDYLMIFSLAVLPCARGAGVGRWMLRFAEEQARAGKMKEVRLYTNALMLRNARIYEKAGYSELGRRPNLRRPGWVFVDMAKPIVPVLS